MAIRVDELRLALEAFAHEHKVDPETVEKALANALRDVFMEKYKYSHPKPRSIKPEVDLNRGKILIRIEFISEDISPDKGEVFYIKAPIRGIFKPKKGIDEEVKFGDVVGIITDDGKSVEIKFNISGKIGKIEKVYGRGGEIVDQYQDLFKVKEVGYEEIITPDKLSHYDVQKLKEKFLYRIKNEILKAKLPRLQAYINRIITGKVQKVDKKMGVLIGIPELGVEGRIPPEGMVKNEVYRPGQDIEAVVLSVEERASYPLLLSRSDPRFVQALLERSIPELQDGTIQIVSIAREAGVMTKIAVKSRDPFVSPVTTLLGPKGTRLYAIKGKMPKGEIIDVIPHDNDIVRFAIFSLQPAKGAVAAYEKREKVDGEVKEEINVYYEDEEEVLKAKGKDGINIKLASRLVGKKINALHVSEFIPPEKGITIYEIKDKLAPEIYEKLKEATLVYFTRLVPLAYMQRLLGTDESTTIRILEIIEDALKEKGEEYV